MVFEIGEHNPQLGQWFLRNNLLDNGHSWHSDSVLAEPAEERVSGFAIPIIKAILATPGVEAVSVHKYEIWVIKAKAFTWGELKPAVDRILIKYLPPTTYKY